MPTDDFIEANRPANDYVELPSSVKTWAEQQEERAVERGRAERDAEIKQHIEHELSKLPSNGYGAPWEVGARRTLADLLAWIGDGNAD